MPSIAADIGGTFTDVALLGDDGTLYTCKHVSTVDDYAQGVLAGIDELMATAGVAASEVAEIGHATTLATNAILQRRGALTGLITTQGFRDVLELGRMRIARQYDLLYEKPSPLVPRALRRGVLERVAADGEVVVPLDEQQAREEIATLVGQGVEAIAICLLNAWANDEHERRLVELVDEIAPGLFCSTSALLPIVGEYERTSTTVVNSYVQPIVSGYLDRLTSGLRERGIVAPLLIMQSSGGVMPARLAAERPAHLVESGPAAGVIGARALASEVGVSSCIAFDMGGTTAKASLVEDGEIRISGDYEVGGTLSAPGGVLLGGHGYALGLPAIEIAEVGAGGGSIAAVDAGTMLQVGPESAGASPGPVCYGLGGTRVTVTDANVALGFISPRTIAGGSVSIDAEAARAALSEQIAEPLGLDLHEAAWAVHTVANARMIGAIRAVTTQRGRDPREFSLVAFGGSGPVHAAGMAELLEIPRVVVPRVAGLFSAMGLLGAERQQTYSRSFFAPLDALRVDALHECYHEMEAHVLEDFADEGWTRANVSFRRTAELRYVGQGHELALAVSDDPVLEELGRRFEAEHERAYGHAFEGAPIEFVTTRVSATLQSAAPGVVAAARDARASVASRAAYFGAGGLQDTTVLGRAELHAERVDGPLIVEEDDATIVVPPGWGAKRDELDNIILERL